MNVARMSGALNHGLAHGCIAHDPTSRPGGGGLRVRDIGARRGLPKEISRDPLVRAKRVRGGCEISR